MGRPIAKQNILPFGSNGIVVTAAKKRNGDILTNLYIHKQRSVNVFDLIDTDGNIYQFMKLIVDNEKGIAIDYKLPTPELIKLLKPNTFFITVKDEDDNAIGLLRKFNFNYWVLSDSIVSVKTKK